MQKLTFKALNSILQKLGLLILLLLATNTLFALDTQPKAKWYRYYDSRGIANISSSVSPDHIRHGYQALDFNMQVIQQNKPYNVEADVKQAPQRAIQAKKQADDLKLKTAYTNSSVAIHKKESMLESIKKQIHFQQDQLKQLQNDRLIFKRQELESLRKSPNLAQNIKNTLDYNAKNIEQKKQTIQSLQSHYRKTQTDYDTIINRLKALEK